MGALVPGERDAVVVEVQLFGQVCHLQRQVAQRKHCGCFGHGKQQIAGRHRVRRGHEMRNSQRDAALVPQAFERAVDEAAGQTARRDQQVRSAEVLGQAEPTDAACA